VDVFTPGREGASEDGESRRMMMMMVDFSLIPPGLARF
jgi:hypothetical protein